MASKRRYTTARAVARSRVIVQTPAQGVWVLTLPVNEGFQDPNEIDDERGVAYGYGHTEELIAPEAITRRLWDELQPRQLASWVRSQAARVGGIPNLARQLVAMEPDPLHQPTDVRNMTRKLEEWAQGKYRKAAGRNARRVAFLQIKTSRIQAGVTGEWRQEIGGEFAALELFRRFNTDATDQEAMGSLQDTLASPSHPGEDLIPLVIAEAGRVQPYPIELLFLHGLHVQVLPGAIRERK